MAPRRRGLLSNAVQPRSVNRLLRDACNNMPRARLRAARPAIHEKDGKGNFCKKTSIRNLIENGVRRISGKGAQRTRLSHAPRRSLCALRTRIVRRPQDNFYDTTSASPEPLRTANTHSEAAAGQLLRHDRRTNAVRTRIVRRPQEDFDATAGVPTQCERA